MNKFYLILIFILFTHIQIISAGGRSDRNESADGAVSLERAIELAAEHIARDLRPGTRIAIVEFESEHDNLSHHIMEELTGELLRHRIEIADRQNLPWIFQEFEFQMSGAVSDETAQSLGKLIGAELIIVGRLLDIVNMYRNQVDAVHVERATRESAARNNVIKDRATQRMIEAIINQTTTVRVYRYAVTEQTNPETAGVFLDRGIMFAMRGEYDRAIADFDEAIRLNPNFAGAYILRGRLLVAAVSQVTYVAVDFSGIEFNTQERISERQAQTYALAIADFSRAIRLDSNNVIAYFERGGANMAIGNLSQAILDYNEAIRLDPNRPGFYSNLGEVYRIVGNHRMAILNYNRAIQLAPYAPIFNNRGIAYAVRGNNDLALADFDQAIQLDPNYTAAYNNRGNLHWLMGNLDQAIFDFNQAIRLNPNLAEAYMNRGIAYQNKGNKDQALADYNEAIRLNPNLIRPYYNRGLLHNERGNFDQAVADFTQAILHDPNHIESYYNRAIAHRQKGDFASAIADWETVLRLDPRNNDARRNLEQDRQRL